MEDAVGRAVTALAASQDGVLSRRRALGLGMSAKAIRCRVESGRWQRVYPVVPGARAVSGQGCPTDMGAGPAMGRGDQRGIYATFSGPIGRRARLWAAVLVCGDGAVLSHESAAELWGLSERPAQGYDGPVHVTVPRGRRLCPPAGIVVHHSSRLDSTRHPVRRPPRTRVEETVVDLAQGARSIDQASGLIAEAVRRRLTTHERIIAAMGARGRLRWRRQLLESCGMVEEGAHSLLELRYVRRVERPHGLPTAVRQARLKTGDRILYVDNRYEGYRARVELDGQRGHTGDGVLRDVWRDNRAAIEGDMPLRLGWDDVELRACESAAVIAKVLIDGGWDGWVTGCGYGCRADATLRSLVEGSVAWGVFGGP
jgi:hypothetical protein